MTTATFDIAAAVRELEHLGSTPAEIAARLAALGVTGAVCDGERCPLANYLHGLGYRGAVATDALELPVDDNIEIDDLPPACAEFITAFDFMDYPELIRED